MKDLVYAAVIVMAGLVFTWIEEEKRLRTLRDCADRLNKLFYNSQDGR